MDAQELVASCSEVTAEANINSTEVPRNPFDLLPDELLLLVFKNCCDRSTQQAAYRSCKLLRDFCNDHMKSVTVKISPGKSLQAARENSSRTMCPQGAFGIEKLILSKPFQGKYNRIAHDNAYDYMEQLVRETFLNPGTEQCRRQQLANITSIDLMLPHRARSIQKYISTVCCLVEQYQNLQTVLTSDYQVLMFLNQPGMRSITIKVPVKPAELHTIANRYPNLHQLEVVMADLSQLTEYQNALDRLPALKQLSITSHSYRISTRGLQLASLPQLSTLALYNLDLLDTHMITSNSFSHLMLGSVSVPKPKEQQPAAMMPALKSVTFATGFSICYPITETLARATLPLPRPGLNITWPEHVYYDADEVPHPQFGYMGAAHMESVGELRVSGQHAKLMLRALVENKVAVRSLDVHLKSDGISSKDVATCLAFPTVTEMVLDTYSTDPIAMFIQIFLHCPSLKTLRLPFWRVPADMKLQKSLWGLGVRCSHNVDFCMTRA